MPPATLRGMPTSPNRHGARSSLALLAMLLLASVALVGPASAATSSDPDGDGLPSTFERDQSKTSPSRKDSDGDGSHDGVEDPDRDTLTNRQEYLAKTHPRKADTDGDGTADWRENLDRPPRSGACRRPCTVAARDRAWRS